MKLFKNINFQSLKDGLSKTHKNIVNSINEVVTGKAVIDDTTLNKIEEILLSADIGLTITEKIIEEVRKKIVDEKDRSGDVIIETVKNEILNILTARENILVDEQNLKTVPYVILVIGVNGAGKTTTIGKLANNYRKSGYSVIVAAADTFRAAANEQLSVWAKRAGVELIEKQKGTDPSSVVFDSVKKAIKEKFDVVIVDTAGRLHNKSNLMNELGKIRKAADKILNGAPHETLLVLDGSVGQNALIQSQEFSKVTEISGLVITKLDGTAKGGAVIQICANQNIPVKYIGVGEKIDDLQNFDPKFFIDAIFSNN